jgi:hypothetical protein
MIAKGCTPENGVKVFVIMENSDMRELNRLWVPA